MRGVVDEHVDIVAHDIPVNAVATALKQFFSDLSQPLVPTQYYDELIDCNVDSRKVVKVRIY